MGGAYQSSYARCSDNNCPCPQVIINRGQGYIFVEDLGNGNFYANLTCEEGARLRNLDLDIARKDAIRWWNTGMVPMRETPKSKMPLEHKRDEAGYRQAREYREWKLKILNSLVYESNGEYIFFDTETTGVPRNYKAPYTDTDNWPRLVQFSWLVGGENKSIIREEDHIIKPVGFVIPNDSSKVHGITTEKALSSGEDLRTIMMKFISDVGKAKYIVGHNVSFDINVVRCECVRLGLKDPFENKSIICTMLSTVDYCKIPNRYGYKWPKLDELHRKLFGKSFENAHNSLADIRATYDCFWELKKLQIL